MMGQTLHIPANTNMEEFLRLCREHFRLETQLVVTAFNFVEFDKGRQMAYFRARAAEKVEYLRKAVPGGPVFEIEVGWATPEQYDTGPMLATIRELQGRLRGAHVIRSKDLGDNWSARHHILGGRTKPFRP